MLEALKLLERRRGGLPNAEQSGFEPAPAVDPMLAREHRGRDCLRKFDAVCENRANRPVLVHDFLEPFPDVLADDWACLGDALGGPLAQDVGTSSRGRSETGPTLGLFLPDYEVFEDDELLPAARPHAAKVSHPLPTWRMPGEPCCRLAERLPAARDPVLGQVLMFSALGRPLSDLISVLELAVAFADARSVDTVLVVRQAGPGWPAEMRKVSEGRGIAEVLAGTASWVDVMQPSGHDRLWIVGPGELSLHHASLPDKRIWEPLRQRPMQVLVEGSERFTPASIGYAAACDGVYLVLPLGSVSRRRAASVARLFRQSGVQLLGAVGIDGCDRIGDI